MIYRDKYKKYKKKYLNLRNETDGVKDNENSDIKNVPEKYIYARYGTANPEQVNNYFWKYMIKNFTIDAWNITQRLNIADKINDNFNNRPAIYCFQRFMQSSITLSDGRKIYVGGEHEDHYDPDFFIYNDIIVISTDIHKNIKDDDIDIYLYPPEIFPPVEDAE